MIHPSINPSINSPIHQSNNQSIHQSIHPSIHPSEPENESIVENQEDDDYQEFMRSFQDQVITITLILTPPPN